MFRVHHKFDIFSKAKEVGQQSKGGKPELLAHK